MTVRGSGRAPVCQTCLVLFSTTFAKVNEKLPDEQKETDEQIAARAEKRAFTVKLGPVWACPRCTQFEDKDGKELLFSEAYPNRAARRAGGGAKRKTGALQRAMGESQKRERKQKQTDRLEQAS